MQMTVAKAAQILRVSPRTVARAVLDHAQGYLQPQRTKITTEELAAAFDCEPQVFEKAIDPEDPEPLLNPQEAASLLKMSRSNFRYHRGLGRYRPVISRGRVVRYTESSLLQDELIRLVF